MPGVCSSICTIGDSGAETSTSASSSLPSSAMTAGVSSRLLRFSSSRSRWLAPSSLAKSPGEPRRRWIEQQVGGHEERQADQQERAPGQDQVPHRDQRLANDARHYAATFSVIGALGSQLSPGSRVNVNASE